MVLSDNFFAPPLPRLFGHRGLALEAPENTLLAFAKALSAGATHIETDVHASKDAVAVISHDPDLTRVLGRDSKISDFTMAELGKLQLGEGQTFVSLEHALSTFPETRFNIDIKSESAERPAADAVRAAGAANRVLITSFDEGRRSRTTALLPGVATSASAPRMLLAVAGAKIGVQALVRYALRDLNAVQVPIRWKIIRIATPRVIRAVHRAGCEFHVWTINDPETMRELLELGIDGLITDRTDLGRKVIDSFL